MLALDEERESTVSLGVEMFFVSDCCKDVLLLLILFSLQRTRERSDG